MDRLDGQISVGLVDADCSSGADPVAVQKEHDLADLHSFLPGTGDPLAALWTDAIHGLQVGGIVAYHSQYFRTEVADQLFRQARAQPPSRSLRQGTVQHPHSWSAGRFQELGLELEPMLLVPDPPTLSGQPFPGAY